MAIFGKFDGIEGDATHQAHKNWVDIDTLQFGVGRAISTSTVTPWATRSPWYRFISEAQRARTAAFARS